MFYTLKLISLVGDIWLEILHPNRFEPEEYDGTGIGLSPCKKIVEQHGGEISLQSKKGEGTVFHFTIEK